MKSILVGAVETTRIAMETLIQKGVPPATLFTLPVSKSSRHSDYVHLEPMAVEHGITVITISNVNHTDVLEKIRCIQPDYSFVIGWSQICRAEFLNIARLGSIGYHPAPLPENRGRAVIPWTILQGQSHTGSTLFWMDEGADSGDILCQEIFPVDSAETASTLYQKHCDSLRRMFNQMVPDLIIEQGKRQPQDHSKATYCAKRIANDGLIDWSLPAKAIWQLIRAATKPYPGAFTFYQGRKLIIWEADLIGTGPYWGVPGQIQQIDEGGVLVQCGDSQHVLIKSAELKNHPSDETDDIREELIPNHALKLHEKLGIDLLSLVPAS